VKGERQNYSLTQKAVAFATQHLCILLGDIAGAVEVRGAASAHPSISANGLRRDYPPDRKLSTAWLNNVEFSHIV
jgi:hypothetical protein